MISEKIILWDTKYGTISSSLKDFIDNKNITKHQLCRLTGLKYDVIIRYYNNTILRFDAEVVAKFCYVLDCAVSDLITYIPKS